MLSVDAIRTCWLFLRMSCKTFSEGVFIYLLINTSVNQLRTAWGFSSFNKKKMFLFSSAYSLIATPLIAFCENVNFYWLVSVILVFFYFWNKRRKINTRLISNCNNIQEIKYALTAASILVFTLNSLNYISRMLMRIIFTSANLYCSSTGIYRDAFGVYHDICGNWVLRNLYKSSIVILHICFVFTVYKLRFIKMKDIKAISAHKWVSISFSLCLASVIYINYVNDYIFTSYEYVLLWAQAFLLPTYWSFYLVVKNLVNLLSIKLNRTADLNIHIWLFNPSMFNTTNLSIYESDVFASNFEFKKLSLKRKLDKLGINDEYKGYSELILCLFLTRLFIGLKGWSFEKDIFWQASLVIDVPVKKLRKDIENILEHAWTINDAETLIDGYYLPYHNINIYDQTRRPTVEQFLTDVAKSI